jgi:hypothetical protein
MEHARYLDIIKRPNLQIMGVKGEEIQTKSIDNLFNRIIAESFPNLERKRVTQVQETCRTPNHQCQKRNTQTYHNQNTQYTEQRRNSESCKREKTSHR